LPSHAQLFSLALTVAWEVGWRPLLENEPSAAKAEANPDCVLVASEVRLLLKLENTSAPPTAMPSNSQVSPLVPMIPGPLTVLDAELLIWGVGPYTKAQPFGQK
jgi:hypothetical protein